MSDHNTAPRRAFRLTCLVDADTRDDLVHTLHSLADRVAREEVTTGCTGGPSSGEIYELLHDPAQTHEVYFQQVRAYLAHPAAAPSDHITTS